MLFCYLFLSIMSWKGTARTRNHFLANLDADMTFNDTPYLFYLSVASICSNRKLVMELVKSRYGKKVGSYGVLADIVFWDWENLENYSHLDNLKYLVSQCDTCDMETYKLLIISGLSSIQQDNFTVLNDLHSITDSSTIKSILVILLWDLDTAPANDSINREFHEDSWRSTLVEHWQHSDVNTRAIIGRISDAIIEATNCSPSNPETNKNDSCTPENDHDPCPRIEDIVLEFYSSKESFKAKRSLPGWIFVLAVTIILTLIFVWILWRYNYRQLQSKLALRKSLAVRESINTAHNPSLSPLDHPHVPNEISVHHFHANQLADNPSDISGADMGDEALRTDVLGANRHRDGHAQEAATVDRQTRGSGGGSRFTPMGLDENAPFPLGGDETKNDEKPLADDGDLARPNPATVPSVSPPSSSPPTNLPTTAEETFVLETPQPGRSVYNLRPRRRRIAVPAAAPAPALDASP